MVTKGRFRNGLLSKDEIKERELNEMYDLIDGKKIPTEQKKKQWDEFLDDLVSRNLLDKRDKNKYKNDNWSFD